MKGHIMAFSFLLWFLVWHLLLAETLPHEGISHKLLHRLHSSSLLQQARTSSKSLAILPTWKRTQAIILQKPKHQRRHLLESKMAQRSHSLFLSLASHRHTQVL